MDKTGCVQARNSTFVWEINNFSNIRTKVGEYIESPFFVAGEVSSNIVKWQIVLYPFGQEDDCKDFLAIYLVCLFYGDVNECEVSYKFHFWDNELKLNIKATRVKFTTKCTRWGWQRFINRNTLLNQNHGNSSGNDTLKIACCITEVATYFANKLNHQTELIESFDSLFLSDRFSDVMIEVDDKKLKAHKNILSARSEVFSAMFNHDTVENKEGVIKIADISYDVMKEVLRFIYCGKVRNLQTHTEDLLAAANKYNLILLKRICEQAIWNNVNVNNVCEFLSISDLHQCIGLKSLLVDFLFGHLKEVVDSSGFNQLTNSNPKLLADIAHKLADSKPELLPNFLHELKDSNPKMLTDILHELIDSNPMFLAGILQHLTDSSPKFIADILHRVKDSSPKLLVDILHGVVKKEAT